VRLDRRWWVAIGVAVVAIVAVVYTVVRQPPEECRPVQALLDFNQSQGAVIEEKTAGTEGVPSTADEAVYRVWADGLAERAQAVTSPDLVRTSAQVADLADQFVAKLPDLRAESQSRAPGAPTPPVVYELDALNKQISAKLAELSQACS
jgi:cyanate lyase